MLTAKDAEVSAPAGNFVKLLTLYTALELTQHEKNAFETNIKVSTAAASITGQHRIYLTPNQTIPLGTLLRAIAILGAEDACLAVADGLTSSRSQFVAAMNQTAQKLRLEQSHYVSPIVNHNNRSSARDLAILAQALRRHYPTAFRWFSEKTFTYLGNTQRSGNPLLWRSTDIEGMMSSEKATSFVTAASYHQNDDESPRQLIAVYLEDNKKNTSDTAINTVLSLLLKGRTDFETIRLFAANTTIARLEVLGGNRDRIDVGSTEDIWVSLSKQELTGRGTGGLSTTIEHLQPFWAPLKKGEVIATLHVDFEGRNLASFPLVAMHDIGEGSFFSRFIDSVRLKISAEPENHP